jgi:hypothetical protein
MENLTTTTELRNAIQAMEEELRVQKEGLKSQIHETYQSINPLNFIKNTIKDAVTSPNTIENIIVGGLSLAAGVITRKIVVGKSTGFLRKLIGSGVQFGTSTALTQNSELIKSAGQYLFKLFSSNKSEKE